MFKEIHKQFERKETDLYELQQNEGFSRYILIRSLANEHLKELFELKTGENTDKGKAEELYEQLYTSCITEDEIIEYIKTKYPDVREQRKEQEVHLPAIIKEFGDVKCGIRNDNLNDTAKDLVRDKSITNKSELEEKVDELLNGTIRGYILWQYYNQVTNDLIEHIFNDHENVIPTLRKIKYVDFMIKVGDSIIPFDLKITHISDDYFDLFEKGLTYTENGDDAYSVGNGRSEIEKIKEHYKSIKKTLGLPNYGGLKKIEMIEILRNSGDLNTQNFLKEILSERTRAVSVIEQDLKSVEWWNYKFQGERLFKNNNRFFVFLAYKDLFEDARPLKGSLEAITEKVEEKLSLIASGDLNNIKYYYQKDKGLEGAYVVNSTSVLVTN
ncbi:hypothetical protein AS19_07960 [Alcanivorax sp. NBRC 101098]|uniref:hypothetical protein n=1 Tax=Alcanivorax sp. NBRC 101098 TaxID=1113728 RepID=UPI0004ABEE12|nr:hypothetical protein [Alcanivorax sp. NBRC 101098]BAP13647.1 hypothetical protein AS19_07960 [Alcanivorax sp. NBRC 101098]